MPQYNFEGSSYNFPEDTSHDEALNFLINLNPEEVSTAGIDTSGSLLEESQDRETYAADFLPGLGTQRAIRFTKEDIEKGDYVSAAFNALGIPPIAGAFLKAGAVTLGAMGIASKASKGARVKGVPKGQQGVIGIQDPLTQYSLNTPFKNLPQKKINEMREKAMAQVDGADEMVHIQQMIDDKAFLTSSAPQTDKFSGDFIQPLAQIKDVKSFKNWMKDGGLMTPDGPVTLFRFVQDPNAAVDLAYMGPREMGIHVGTPNTVRAFERTFFGEGVEKLNKTGSASSGVTVPTNSRTLSSGKSRLHDHSVRASLELDSLFAEQGGKQATDMVVKQALMASDEEFDALKMLLDRTLKESVDDPAELLIIEKSLSIAFTDLRKIREAGGGTFPLVTNIKNPLPMEDPPGGNWNARTISNKLSEMPEMAQFKKKLSDIYHDLGGQVSLDSPQNIEANKKLQGIIKEAGYDSIVYVNRFESAGDLSFILFDEDNIKRVSDIMGTPQ